MNLSLTRKLAALAFALACAGTVLAQSGDDPVLIENSQAAVRRSDLDAELQRLPADRREAFMANPRAIQETLRRLLVERTLAAQARQRKLEQDPTAAAIIAGAHQRLLADLFLMRAEELAATEFDAALPKWEARAKELHVIDAKKYEMPEQVATTHVLFRASPRSDAEAKRLAEDIRAKALAGADLNALAVEHSEDSSAKSNRGSLGFFPRSALDPAYADAAFKLAKTGDLSEPVKSSFGWHVIRLDGRKPAAPRPFDEVRAQILGELKQQYVVQKREEAVAQARALPASVNTEAIDAVVAKAKSAATSPSPSVPVPSK
jgi:peptidyl-prolyl cis-trans isomerase C